MLRNIIVVLSLILILIAVFFLLSCICFALEPLSPTGIVLIIYCLLFRTDYYLISLNCIADRADQGQQLQNFFR